MAVTYEGDVGTMTCDNACGSTYRDGQVDTAAHTFRRRAIDAGWKSHRPNAYRQMDLCPDCPVEDW